MHACLNWKRLERGRFFLEVFFVHLFSGSQRMILTQWTEGSSSAEPWKCRVLGLCGGGRRPRGADYSSRHGHDHSRAVGDRRRRPAIVLSRLPVAGATPRYPVPSSHLPPTQFIGTHCRRPLKWLNSSITASVSADNLPLKRSRSVPPPRPPSLVKN